MQLVFDEGKNFLNFNTYTSTTNSTSFTGKFLESVWKQHGFKLTAQQKLLQRWINKLNFKGRVVLNESTGLALIEMGWMKIYLDKFI